MDKTLEVIAIQVAPCPHFPMIVERPGLSHLGTAQRISQMRIVDG